MTSGSAAADDAPPRPFARRFVPRPVAALGRRVRTWRAEGPRLGRYEPRSMLELESHPVDRSSVPCVDVHTHLGRWLSTTGAWMEPDVSRLIALLEACNVESVVNLDGRWGRELEENLDRYDRNHPDRFFTFCHLDWRQLGEPGGVDRLVQSLERSRDAGAKGLKVWKDLGLHVKVQGRLVLPDDERLAPLFEAAGALGLPVLIHVADPVAFFHPVDRHNERVEELLRFPRAARRGGLSAFRRLVEALEHVVRRHRTTTFIGAHVGCYAENLAWVSGMLERNPNFHVDISARAAELGRQPRAARALILRHPDRVLFGTDVFPLRSAVYGIYFRMLETADEAFPYSDEPIPGQGRWTISGLDLPGDVLEKLYRLNARRLLTPAPDGSGEDGRPGSAGGPSPSVTPGTP